ncbi:MAG: S9 family peptidase [Candidatus Latescibacteria bacterium]|nr:S9 family peptidase [Candidatus Latescibacterota bacterium]
MKKPVSIPDLFATRTVSDPRISPDGKWVAYVATEADLKENRYNSDVHLIPAQGGEPFKLTNSPKRDEAPRWSPDGARIAFLSGRGEKDQVYVIRPFGGEAERVTNARSGVSAFAWSPDGARIAYLTTDAPTEEEEKAKKERGDARVVDRDDRMSHLHVIDLKTKEARRLTKGRFHVTGLTWSPDGRRIAFSHQPSPLANNMFRATLSLVPASGGRPQPLTDGRGDVGSIEWSPDGRWIAFLSRGDGGGWLASLHIRLVSPLGGPVRDLTPRLEDLGRFTESAWAPDGRALYFFLGQGTSMHICRVRLNGKTEQITQGSQVYGAMSLSQDGRTMAFIRQDGATPPDVHVSPTARFEPRRLTTVNPQVRDHLYGRKEIVHWKNPDGTPVEGLLIKPVGYRVGRRYPLLVSVHGGPAGAFANTFDGVGQGVYPVQVFAGRGYALLLPNPRGSVHYGEKFRRANVRDWGKGDFADIMAGVDHLIGRGIADPNRLGIMGWSYGGYMTGWAITQTNRFRAASFGAGLTNLISMYGQTDIPGFLEAYFEAIPWNDVETYMRHSAMGHAGKIRTPTLIQHGEKDVRVPLPQSYELYQALKRRRIPTEFVIYPRQGHGLSEPKLIRDAMERNLAWFEAWVRRKAGKRQIANGKR